MISSNDAIPMQKNNPLLSWELLLLKILLFALAAVLLSKPAGSISGQIAMEQPGYNLHTYDMKNNKLYAIATGPRGGQEEERGVWVDKDGKFQINQLPVGEYSLRIRVPGFSTAYEQGIFVEEAKVSMLPREVRLDLSHPSVNIASNSRVFTGKELPRFWVNASSANSVKVNVYKKDLLAVLGSDNEKKLGIEMTPELSVYKPYGQDHEHSNIFASDKPIQEWQRTLKPDSEDWSHEEFKFAQALPPGDYFASVEVFNTAGESDWGMLWFSVTDLGLIVKQDREKMLVRAIDLNNLKPLSDVDLSVFDRDQKKILCVKGSVKTGADGFATIPLPDNCGTSLLASGFQGEEHAYGGLSIYQYTSDKHRTYFYPDRPVYRLGQTVHFKAICRDLKSDGLKNAGGEQLMHVTIEDPDNQKIEERDYKTSKHGTFNGSFEIPAEGKTGAYQFTIAYPDGIVDYERVEIAQYRKPEYQVEVVPLSERVIAGSKAKARIKASYYFGAPVTNAKVKYSIYSEDDWSTRYKLQARPDYCEYFDDWSSNDDYSYGEEFVAEGYAETDSSGEAIVEFETKPIATTADAVFSDAYRDKKYRVEVEVTDISRLSVLNSNSVPVTAGNFELFVEPQNYVVKAGEKISTDFSAVDYHGDPVAGASVKLKLVRRPYDTVNSTYREPLVLEEISATTDAEGKGHVDFKTETKYQSDTYEIIGSSEDQEQHRIATASSVWISSPNYPYALGSNEAQKQPLSIKLDKKVYKPGETAKVLITAPVTGQEGTQAIVSVEGLKLHNYKVVDLKSTACLVEIPIQKDYAPNIYVSCVFIGKKHQFYSQSELVKVSPLDRFLAVEISTDKPKYKPGELAEYTVKAKQADGKPAANVELSLGIVDESIYAIRPEYVQSICKFFYNQRSNMVNTICSFPEEYSGGPNKIEPRVRKDFRDTAIWLPSLITNDSGIVKAKVKMPDNLTTWRATVRAVSLNSDVGWSMQKVVSTQDLIVRLALPRFFTQGDEGQISAIVHNYSDSKQIVNLNLSISKEFQLQEDLKKLKKQVTIEPEKAARISWPTLIMSAGTGTIGIKAVGQTAGDAMELKLPLRPLGVRMLASASGMIESADQSVPLPLAYPKDAAVGSVKSSICISSSSLGPILGNFSSLIDYPYGCTEQTMSKLMPSVVAIKMNKSIGVPLEAKDIERFKNVYKQSMTKLDDYQHADGGWGWWADDKSQPYLTALVLEGYSLLKEAKYKVDPEREKRGIAWLKKAEKELRQQLSDPLLSPNQWNINTSISDLAKANYALSINSAKPSPDLKQWLQKKQMHDRLSPESLAYFCLVFSKSGDTTFAQSLYHRLIYLANIHTSNNGELMSWDRSSEMLRKLGNPDYQPSYHYTDVEITALALRACLAMEPSNTNRIEAIKNWILTQRGKDGWGNTKTTAEVFRAFTDAEAARTDGKGTDFTVEITSPPWRNEEQQAAPTLHFDSKSGFRPEQQIALEVLPGDAQRALHKVGKGRLYWTQTLSYYKAIKSGDTSIVGGTPKGLKLKRSFYRLIAKAPDGEGKVRFEQVPLSGPVKAGETLLMKVKIDSPIHVPYTLIEAALPSGGEVVARNPKERLSDNETGSNEIETDLGFGSWWWNHQDILDDHMAFFVTDFPNKSCEIHTMVRMELPGKFQMNPVTLEGMYTNDIRGYSQADVIEVKE